MAGDSVKLEIRWDPRFVRSILPAMQKAASSLLGQPIVDAVKDEVKAGKSPVEGQGRFAAYSPSYSTQIRTSRPFREAYPEKRVRPVNLYLKGKMMGSLYAKPTNEGTKVAFKDKKAEFHNDTGAGKSRVIRRLLPNRKGETFSRTIMQKLVKIVSFDILKRAFASARGG